MSKTLIPGDVEAMLNELVDESGDTVDDLLREAVTTLVARRRLRHLESVGSEFLPSVRSEDVDQYLDTHWAKSLECR
jgi:hypothetical protein